MDATEAANNALGSLIPYFVMGTVISILLIILFIALLVKIWIACTDIREIKEMYDETHPLIPDEHVPTRSTK